MIIKNCELYFAKLDPTRPNAKFNKKNPTWELQIRTSDQETRKQWTQMGLNVKPVVPDEGEPFFRVNLRKKSTKEDGEKASPVDVVDAQLNPVDAKSIGNGSVGNVKVFQYEYTREGGGKGIASVLMGVQLLKHIVYVPKPRDDDFEPEGETEVFEPSEEDINF